MNSKKKCLGCGKFFRTETMIKAPIGNFHSKDCRYEYATTKQSDLKKRTTDRIDKEFAVKKANFKLSDKAFRAKEAQIAFNKYIRIRDDLLSCISCDKHNDGTHQRHASHYRSVGACTALRFNEDNVHASCMQCNSHFSGNITEYRIRLIKKIGLDKVEWLECQNQIVKYTCEQLKEIELYYKEKLNKLKL